MVLLAQLLYSINIGCLYGFDIVPLFQFDSVSYIGKLYSSNTFCATKGSFKKESAVSPLWKGQTFLTYLIYLYSFSILISSYCHQKYKCAKFKKNLIGKSILKLDLFIFSKTIATYRKTLLKKSKYITFLKTRFLFFQRKWIMFNKNVSGII